MKKKNIWERFINKFVLENFFKISLTSMEKEIAIISVKEKYAKCLRNSIINGILIFPAIIFLDTQIIISVLIPITLVAGAAWFSISLSNVKKKFENFGFELTTNIFESFVTSLLMLILISAVSLINEFLSPLISLFQNKLIILTSGILGILIIFKIIYKIFTGSIKYDINDAMLIGQAEVAEKFFKKSLSFLNITSDNLRDGKHMEVANYCIGLSFFEIYTYINTLEVFDKKEIDKHLDTSNSLIDNPTMDKEESKKIAIDLINQFLFYVKIKNNENVNKSIRGIKDELRNLSKKTKIKESKQMIDTRLGIIFQEIAEMIHDAGENLFKKD